MMVDYRLNEKWTIQAGKMCQNWGGYEFDANPMYIYQYSDMVDNLDSPKAGLVVVYPYHHRNLLLKCLIQGMKILKHPSLALVIRESKTQEHLLPIF